MSAPPRTSADRATGAMMSVFRRTGRGRPSGERGAALVEFAFLLPVLLLLVVGIIEFGRTFNAQISLTGAAREGARYMAIHGEADEAEDVVIEAAGLATPPTVDISPTTCSSNTDVTVTASQTVEIFIPFFGGPSFDLKGVAVMRCGG